jgi:hypothetical protein
VPVGDTTLTRHDVIEEAQRLFLHHAADFFAPVREHGRVLVEIRVRLDLECLEVEVAELRLRARAIEQAARFLAHTFGIEELARLCSRKQLVVGHAVPK